MHPQLTPGVHRDHNRATAGRWLALAAGLGAWFAVPATAGHRESKLDRTSALLSCGGVVVLVHALSEAANSGWNSLPVLGFLALAVALLGAFVVRQARHPHPLLAAALAFLPTPAANLFASTQLSGRLPARFGPRPLLAGGLFVRACGLLLATRLTPDASFVPVILPMQLLPGLGAGPCMPVVLNVATRDVGGDRPRLHDRSGLRGRARRRGRAHRAAPAPARHPLKAVNGTLRDSKSLNVPFTDLRGQAFWSSPTSDSRRARLRPHSRWSSVKRPPLKPRASPASASTRTSS
jgi:hypothetical protein